MLIYAEFAPFKGHIDWLSKSEIYTYIMIERRWIHWKVEGDEN